MRSKYQTDRKFKGVAFLRTELFLQSAYLLRFHEVIAFGRAFAKYVPYLLCTNFVRYGAKQRLYKVLQSTDVILAKQKVGLPISYVLLLSKKQCPQVVPYDCKGRQVPYKVLQKVG
jgi:hypothetical protein